MNCNPVIRDIAWSLPVFGANISPPYWFDGDGTYCCPCARIEYGFERLAWEFGIDGGWSGEEDGCLQCDRCGRLLEYSLTDYGTLAEIERFFHYPPSVLTPDEAYQITKALDNAAYMEDIQGKAFVVAIRAMGAIPRLPPPSHS